MFNLFNSKGGVPAASKYPAVVEEVHNEFMTAGDRILKEAEVILEEAKESNIDKGKRLAAVGFVKAPEAVRATEVQQKMVWTKEVAELVGYYRVNYPNNKFITEEQVKAICEKYGLVCGDISMYKGFVPEKKLVDIENFKLKDCDIPNILFEIISGHEGKLPRYHGDDLDLTELGKTYFKVGATGYITGIDGKPIYPKPLFTEKCIAEFLGIKFVEVRVVDKKTKKICASLKDMEIPSGKQVKGYKIQDIPDPVVLQPIKGGYLIVAAWGDEASDENVINQNQN